MDLFLRKLKVLFSFLSAWDIHKHYLGVFHVYLEHDFQFANPMQVLQIK